MAAVVSIGKMIHRKPYQSHFKNGKWHYATDEWEVRIMAICEGYAMVRRKGMMPYVAPVKELFEGRAKEEG